MKTFLRQSEIINWQLTNFITEIFKFFLQFQTFLLIIFSQLCINNFWVEKMGNAVDKVRDKIDCSWKLDQFRKAILSVVEDHWKEEWKVAVREIAEQVEIRVENFQSASARHNNRSCGKCIDNDKSKSKDIKSIWFRHVPKLEINLKRGVSGNEALWTFPKVKVMEHHKYSTAIDAYHCLGLAEKAEKANLNSRLPFNLWYQVYCSIYRFCNVAIPRTSSKLDESIIAEYQFYVLPQHYSVFVYCQVSHDRGWMRLDSMRAAEIEGFPFYSLNQDLAQNGVARTTVWGQDSGFTNRLRNFIVRSQAEDVAQLLFRHDLQKQKLACQIVSNIDLNSWRLPHRRSMPAGLQLSTVDVGIGWQENADEQVLVCSLRAPDISSQSPTKLTESKIGSELEYKQAQATELLLLSHFDPYELGTLFQWIIQMSADYFTMFCKLHYNRDFPNLNDHFSNPKQLRGRLTDTNFGKSAESFRRLIITASQTFNQLSSLQQQSEQCLFPKVLCTLTTDYLSFPLPPCPWSTAQQNIQISI